MNKAGLYIKVLVIAALVGIGLYIMGSGLMTGEIYFPGKHGTALVSLSVSPSWYWMTVVLWLVITSSLCYFGFQALANTKKKQ